METPPVHSLSLNGVILETRRIIRANYNHFSNLSFLFFPLAVTILVTPALHLSGHFSTAADHHHKSPIHRLLYLLTVYILSVSAIATITSSTHTAFHGNPINFSTSIKTLATSFFPILSTSILIHLLHLCISLTFLMFVGTIAILLQTLGLGLGLGFVIDYKNSTSEFMSWFYAAIIEALLVILIYFQVNWSLAFPIVVAESKRGGFGVGAKRVLSERDAIGFVVVVVTLRRLGFLFLVLVYTKGELANDGLLHMFSWGTLLMSTMFTCCLMMFMVISTASNTVLYMYCKALHGELALEVAEKVP